MGRKCTGCSSSPSTPNMCNGSSCLLWETAGNRNSMDLRKQCSFQRTADTAFQADIPQLNSYYIQNTNIHHNSSICLGIACIFCIHWNNNSCDGIFCKYFRLCRVHIDFHIEGTLILPKTQTNLRIKWKRFIKGSRSFWRKKKEEKISNSFFFLTFVE